mmetsp:Transcript_22319/g.51111  ORF Transcript_22319/g.51111 Transcript_22319/m.51111 type:complete len:674 (-) Transcript_22319:51-2072(-)
MEGETDNAECTECAPATEETFSEPPLVEEGNLTEEEQLNNITLDQFELFDNSAGEQDSLGKGSFGLVQKVRVKGTTRVYALKSMRKQDVIESNLIDQVELEIKVQKELKHRNVLRLHRHFEDNDNVYLLLELCAKGELYQMLRTQRCRRFPEQVACRFFIQVAAGLHYLHNQSIVHRDIKPENLLVTQDDVLKIADFGWCAMTTTLRTTFCGTLDYLAPEMIQGIGHNHALDIWSAGVLLYEMMVGRPPFQSTNHGQLIFKILSLDLKFPAFISKEASDLVRRLVQNNPRDRMPLLKSLLHPWVVMHIPEEDRIECAQSCGQPLLHDVPFTPKVPHRELTEASHVSEPLSFETSDMSRIEAGVRSGAPRHSRVSEAAQSPNTSSPRKLRTVRADQHQNPQPAFSPQARSRVLPNQHQRPQAGMGRQQIYLGPQQGPSYRPDVVGAVSPVVRVRTMAPPSASAADNGAHCAQALVSAPPTPIQRSAYREVGTSDAARACPAATAVRRQAPQPAQPLQSQQRSQQTTGRPEVLFHAMSQSELSIAEQPTPSPMRQGSRRVGGAVTRADSQNRTAAMPSPTTMAGLLASPSLPYRVIASDTANGNVSRPVREPYVQGTHRVAVDGSAQVAEREETRCLSPGLVSPGLVPRTIQVDVQPGAARDHRVINNHYGARLQ